MIKNSLKEAAKKYIQQITRKLNDLGYNSITTPVEKQYNYECEVINGKEKVKILVYFGKKGVTTVLQGAPASELYLELDTIINSSTTSSQKKVEEYSNYIGSDETGKGDFFGPLVTCAVYVNDKLITELQKLGVKDSKQLSDTRIKTIAAHLRSIGNDYYETISINPQKYNEMYERFKNINELLNWSHTEAIENLAQRFEVETVITDKFRLKEIKFSKNFDSSKYKLIQIPKAEKYTAVAAASILARDKQLDWFEAQKKKGIILPKGAADIVKDAAKNIIEKFGRDELPNYIKMHFKTTGSL